MDYYNKEQYKKNQRDKTMQRRFKGGRQLIGGRGYMKEKQVTSSWKWDNIGAVLKGGLITSWKYILFTRLEKYISLSR